MLQTSLPTVSLGTGSTVRMYAFRGSDLLVRVEGIHVTPASGADVSRMGLTETHRCQVGRYSSAKVSAVMLAEPKKLPEGFELRPLRSLLCVLDDRMATEASVSSQVLTWDMTSKFCGTCGQKTQAAESEYAKKCTSCGATVFPRISPATITAVVRDRQILLAHNHKFREGMYSLVAGFVEAGESLEDCVRREVLEEVGVVVSDVTYFGSQPWPFPDALMVGFTATYHSGDITPDGVEIADAQWFEARALPQIPAPGSISRRIIDWFCARYA